MSEEFKLTEIATLLSATPVILETTLKTTPHRLTRYQPTPADWSINEVIGHLIEAEQRGFAGHIRLMLSEEHHTCIGWEPDEVAAARHDNDKNAIDLLAEFAAMRQQNVELVRNLQPAQVQRLATHKKVGTISVRDLLGEWAYHDLNYIKQIESNIASAIWGQMGNTQRFYL